MTRSARCSRRARCSCSLPWWARPPVGLRRGALRLIIRGRARSTRRTAPRSTRLWPSCSRVGARRSSAGTLMARRRAGKLRVLWSLGSRRARRRRAWRVPLMPQVPQAFLPKAMRNRRWRALKLLMTTWLLWVRTRSPGRMALPRACMPPRMLTRLPQAPMPLCARERQRRGRMWRQTTRSGTRLLRGIPPPRAIPRLVATLTQEA